MLLSVICPTLNEEDHIEKILDLFQKSSPSDKEIIIIDGNSIDKTREIVEAWVKTYDNIHLIINQEKYVSFALNKAIPKCKGKYIVRLDAHTDYTNDYFEKIISTFEQTDAEIVGGPMRAIGNSDFQKACAKATSVLFGIGGSQFHDTNYKGYADSVYLGAWQSEIFKEIGLFDEKLIRNQDDEFHFRAKSKGKKIYLNPEIKSYYYPRSDFKSLFKQYFQYGFYKPLVLKKVRSGLRIWHLVPSIFTLYLLTLPFALISFYWLLPLFLYLFISFFYSFNTKENWALRNYIFAIFLTIHVSYGSGFLLGLRLLCRK